MGRSTDAKGGPAHAAKTADAARTAHAARPALDADAALDARFTCVQMRELEGRACFCGRAAQSPRLEIAYQLSKLLEIHLTVRRVIVPGKQRRRARS